MKLQCYMWFAYITQRMQRTTRWRVESCASSTTDHSPCWPGDQKEPFIGDRFSTLHVGSTCPSTVAACDARTRTRAWRVQHCPHRENHVGLATRSGPLVVIGWLSKTTCGSQVLANWCSVRRAYARLWRVLHCPQWQRRLVDQGAKANP